MVYAPVLLHHLYVDCSWRNLFIQYFVPLVSRNTIAKVHTQIRRISIFGGCSVFAAISFQCSSKETVLYKIIRTVSTHNEPVHYCFIQQWTGVKHDYSKVGKKIHRVEHSAILLQIRRSNKNSWRSSEKRNLLGRNRHTLRECYWRIRWREI